MGDNYRINKGIRAKSVRLVGAAGEQVGIVSIEDAMRRAQEAGLDIVEVASSTDPPVCRIMDYGKFRYEKLKQQRQARKKQKSFTIKQIRVRPKIGEHDYQVKLKHAIAFLKEGNKIKFSLMFRGREMAHQELGRNVLQKFITDLAGISVIEQRPTLQTRFMNMVLGPK